MPFSADLYVSEESYIVLFLKRKSLSTQRIEYVVIIRVGVALPLKWVVNTYFVR